MDLIKNTFIFLCFTALHNSAFAFTDDACDKHKKKAEHYNDVMREKGTTATAVNAHRKWMNKYYECTSNRDNRARRTNKASPTPPTPFQLPKVPISTNASSTRYHNYNGQKRLAWSTYFKEPARCINNRTDFALFVKCATARKAAMERFNKLWNEQSTSAY